MERIPAMSKPALRTSRIVLCLLMLGSAGIAASQEAARPAPKPTLRSAPAGAPAATTTAAPTAATTAAPPAAPKDPKEEARRAQVLVTYAGGKALTVGDLEDAVGRQSPHLRKRFTDQAELKDLLDKTLRFALLADEAEKRGYDKNPTVTQSVKQNSVQALMKADFDEEAQSAAVTETEVKAYYDEHLSEYQRPAMKRASHIVVATLDEAKAILAEAKAADLRTFRTLAREKSIDEATKLRGGDLQYFDPKGKAQPSGEVVVTEAFAKAVSQLKAVGDVVATPIKVDAGYSVAKLTGERPAISRKLAEVSDSIRTRIARTRRQEAIDAFVKALQDKTKPEVFAERAEAIVLDTSELKGAGVPEGFPHGRTTMGAEAAMGRPTPSEGQAQEPPPPPAAAEGEAQAE
jgi:peptidyl-prolyl cis-trans isomerase C